MDAITLLTLLTPCYSKCVPRTSIICITWEPVRNAQSQAPLQTCNQNLYFNKVLRCVLKLKSVVPTDILFLLTLLWRWTGERSKDDLLVYFFFKKRSKLLIHKTHPGQLSKESCRVKKLIRKGYLYDSICITFFFFFFMFQTILY